MTKNPLILTSVNHINNWFKNQITTPEELARFNMLDIIDTDRYLLDSSLPKRQRLNRYNDIEGRLEKSRRGVNR